ncbi:MAG: hypothetical protein ABEN55_20805 [Bradymonadaceae bacterium]
MDFPDEWTDDAIEALADELEQHHINRLQRAQGQERHNELFEKIEAQVEEDAGEIVGPMTTDGYYEQDLEIDPHNSVRFRSISRNFQDKIYDDIPRSQDPGQIDMQKQRKRNLLKLSYMLLEHNGRQVGPVPVQGSLFDKMLESGVDVFEEIEQNADERRRQLELMPEVVVNRLSNARDIWESIIISRVQSAHMNTQEVMGNSSTTPDNPPSRG